MRARTFVFHSGELTLEGELVTPENPKAALILCHGIPSGGPPDPEDAGYPGFARRMASEGFACLWFNFRGCRGAPGEFSFAGCSADLDAAIDAVRAAPETRGLPVIVVGSSFGGSAAIAVCSQRPDVAAVATLAAPAGFEDHASEEEAASLIARFRNIGIIHDPAYPPDPGAWAREMLEMSPEGRIKGIAPRPVLLIQGEADEVVPYPHAERLFAAAAAPKELVRIPGGHHQLRRDERALDALSDWLERWLPRLGDSPAPAGHPE